MIVESEGTRQVDLSLVAGLTVCSLCEAATALEILAQPGNSVTQRAAALGALDLIGAYGRREVYLASFDSPYTSRLKHAVGEFLAQLKSHRTQAVDVFDIRAGGEDFCLVFRLSPEGSIVGCLPKVDRLKMDTERWQALWRKVA